MNLDELQKSKVAAWIQEGLSLSQIQSRLASELDLRLTYMEVRFLMDDLKLRPKDQESSLPPAAQLPKPAAAPLPDPRSPPSPKSPLEPKPQPGAGVGSRVTVSVDQVTRPGALASGSVSFTDGHSAEWQLDQFGRLGLVPKQAGHKPSQQDLMAFQAELQNELAKLGF